MGSFPSHAASDNSAQSQLLPVELRTAEARSAAVEIRFANGPVPDPAIPAMPDRPSGQGAKKFKVVSVNQSALLTSVLEPTSNKSPNISAFLR